MGFADEPFLPIAGNSYYPTIFSYYKHYDIPNFVLSSPNSYTHPLFTLDDREFGVLKLISWFAGDVSGPYTPTNFVFTFKINTVPFLVLSADIEQYRIVDFNLILNPGDAVTCEVVNNSGATVSQTVTGIAGIIRL